ncbi:AfsR/SARP family transcriptional regulator, partial [Amaricoccus sp. W119]|uniref:AfsR/SARP family transcriptional regulator n=1 Tax=Amaricoccus sp. W119 TaxID=3391833 RepID=UPI0039A67296
MRIPRISLLGEPRLTDPDGLVLATPGPKAMALLACLASAPGMRLSRSALVELLWADARSTSAARHALRQCLVRLRAHMGAAGRALAADDGAVWLEPDLVAVDLEMLAASTRDEVVATSLAIRGRF